MKAVQCVSFPNRQGLMLHGMLHEPDAAVARGVCILLLSPGIKGRVGPHRLYLKIAARLVPMGFHVLRFDYHGLGDSAGELAERVMADMYNSIQGGRYVEDTIAAMDWMQVHHGIRRFVGSGLCGGSISALLTAARDQRIESLLGIGLPSTLEGGAENFDRFMSRGQLRQEGRSYLRKLLRPESWKRFLTGRSGYGLIVRAVKEVVLPARKAPAPVASAPERDNANPLFAPAFLALMQRKSPILLIFSAADRHRHNFAEKFEERYAPAIARTGHEYQLHRIENANHVLSERIWLDEMLDVTAPWLDQHYPLPPR